ncbi:MAG: hypothetical protein Q9198_009521, partial [Flavoplaca austrocitrina]
CQPRANTRGVHEVEQPDEGRAHVTCESDGGLSVDGRLQAANVEFGNDQEVEQDVDGKFDGADYEWYSRGKSSKGAQAYVGQACSPHAFRYETLSKRASNRDKDEAQHESEQALEQDQSVGETQSSVEGSCRFVADNQPCRPG